MMLDRKLAALGLLTVLSVLGFAGVRTFSTAAAPATQFELVRGAIHAGTCRNADQPAVVTLESFTRSGAPDDATAPLLSTTEAPVALSDLLASPHALLVTLGGDRAALLACGEIEGAAGAPTANLELSERNDSGLSGIALLLGGENSTQVSIILNVAVDTGPAATPAAGAQGTPVTPAATPPAGGTTPVASPTAGAASPTARAGFPIPTPGSIAGGPTATPAGAEPTPTVAGIAPTATAVTGGLPNIPIFLPPVAGQEAPVGTEVAPTAAAPTAVGVTPGTYTSLEFGYSLVIPEGWEISEASFVEAGLDSLVLTNGVSTVGITGQASPLAAPECLDEHFTYLQTLPEVTLIIPRTGPDAAVTTRTPERAIEVWDIVFVNAMNQPVSNTLYVDCRVLAPGQATLLIVHSAPAAEFSNEVLRREELLQGLTLQ